MQKLEILREVLGTVAVVTAYIGAVLILTLADVGLTLLLVKWAGKVKKLSHLPQPDVPLPQLPDDHKVVVVGGAVRRWE